MFFLQKPVILKEFKKRLFIFIPVFQEKSNFMNIKHA
jgi:hypothetical protein